MSARWDGYAEVYAASNSKNSEVFVYEVFQKGPNTYVSWMDANSEKGDMAISVFENDGQPLNSKALQKPGGMDAIFASRRVRDDIATSPDEIQSKLIDALDMKIRNAAPDAPKAHIAGADHGMTTIKNVARRPGMGF